MRGDDKVRHCASCDREVFALSAMTAEEAELRLLNAGDALPCIRYARSDDGQVLHLAAARAYALPAPYGRAFVAASALGLALAPAAAFGEGKRAKKEALASDGCVVFQKDAPIIASAGAAATPPAAAPPAAASPARAGAAAAPPAQPTTTPQDRPVMMGGAPPPMQHRPEFGTLVLKSKIARDIKIGNIALKAPIDGYFLTPGKFAIEVREPSGKVRKLNVTIAIDVKTTIDLDKP